MHFRVDFFNKFTVCKASVLNIPHHVSFPESVVRMVEQFQGTNFFFGGKFFPEGL